MAYFGFGRSIARAALAWGLLAGCATAALAAPEAVATSKDGALLPVSVDRADGRMLVTLPPMAADGTYGRFLYATVLRTGLGSATVRLDRAMNGPTHVLAFRRFGKKVAAVFENPQFRASGTAAVEAGAKGSFPESIVWMGDIVSQGPAGVTVDLSSFFTQDVMDIAATLNSETSGFRLSEALSATDAGSVKVFPDNIEVDAYQTFVADKPGKQVTMIASEPRKVSLIVHHSLVRLPGPGYTPRRYDIRTGGFFAPVYDYGTPLGQPIVNDLAARFRLEKTDPNAARSAVKKPIVFYIDDAAPEPIRTALEEGVSWWNQAFDAAGFVNAFQVKPLTPDIDPLDIRYNVVNWIDRLTRAWSWGQWVIDPRTGEIVKSSVILGALRVRQDITIFESLVGKDQENTGGPNDPSRAALARIRQLGAHEVGHAIGFVHNFAGSMQGRISVMDYPGPRIGLKDGQIDLSDAYATGIGTWDKFTVDWLYGQPKPGEDAEKVAEAKAAAMEKTGMIFSTDIDGRAPETPSPTANMWDDGTDSVGELAKLMEVRRIGLARFGPQVLNPGEPLSNLRRVFVPLWLLHRYQMDAAAKLVGGVDYPYGVAGGNRPMAKVVPAADQAKALSGLLATLSPDALTVPAKLLPMLSMGVNGRSDPQFDNEVFANAGSAVFDPLVATDVAARQMLETLLAPERLTRVYEQKLVDPGQLGLDTVLDRLTATVVDRHATAVERQIAYRAVLTLARTRMNPKTSPNVALLLEGRLRGFADRFGAAKGESEEALWSRGLAALLRDKEALRAALADKADQARIPPGMPIGGSGGWFDDLDS
ncbi:DUF5117 domain-containing protein [Sphingomonas sp. AP4-R1]|uniref:zinc-dependent metalloprotease n=1 Tax=Sphingomonas sp. AP4-R1 TaxID=2735134 RepID=UPI00149395A4|nr:zinc-dependent metalloprotease [Sphingomonas sp. AP4-R1]QJU56572.1 DUF5117 domain-containing protein [Sphingomonas sp. AP4-R1]